MFNRYRYTTGVRVHKGWVDSGEEDAPQVAYAHFEDGYHVIDGNTEVAFTQDRDVAELIVRALNSFGERP